MKYSTENEKKIIDRYYKSFGRLMQLGIENVKSIEEMNEIAKQLIDYGKHCPKIRRKYEKATLDLQNFIAQNQ